MALLLDEIDAPPEEPLVLPMPQDPRALPVAQQILSAPAADETLQALARQHGASARTLERVFRGETGMSFGVWRQKARLLWSIRILAAGGSVTEAALDSGYGSVSAFIAAFKQTFGSTPGTMMDSSRPGSSGA
jgi:AraC-like DNA-binding protein